MKTTNAEPPKRQSLAILMRDVTYDVTKRMDKIVEEAYARHEENMTTWDFVAFPGLWPVRETARQYLIPEDSLEVHVFNEEVKADIAKGLKELFLETNTPFAMFKISCATFIRFDECDHTKHNKRAMEKAGFTKVKADQHTYTGTQHVYQRAGMMRKSHLETILGKEISDKILNSLAHAAIEDFELISTPKMALEEKLREAGADGLSENTPSRMRL